MMAMRVPSRERQVSPQAVPTSIGAGGPSLARGTPVSPARGVGLGEGLQALSRATQELLEKNKARRDRTAENRAYAGYMEGMGEIERELFKREGGAAEGVTAEGMKRVEELFTGLTADLGEDKLADFSARVAPNRRAFGLRLSQHESTNLDADELQQRQAAIGADIRAIGDMPVTAVGVDWDALEGYRANLVQEWSQDASLDASVVKHNAQVDFGKGISSLIANLVSKGDTDHARQVFERYKGDIDPGAIPRLETAIDKQETDNAIVDLSKTTLQAHGGKFALPNGLAYLRGLKGVEEDVRRGAIKQYTQDWKLNNDARLVQESGFLSGVEANLGVEGYDLPVDALRRLFGAQKARELEGLHTRYLLRKEPSPQMMVALAKYDLNKDNPDYFLRMDEDTALALSFDIAATGVALNRPGLGAQFRQTWSKYHYGAVSDKASRRTEKFLYSAEDMMKDAEMSVMGKKPNEYNDEEVQRARQFRERIGELERQQPDMPKREIIDQAVNELQREDDWVDEDMRASAVTLEDLGHLHIPKARWRGSELETLPRQWRALSSRRLGETEMERLMSWRRLINYYAHTPTEDDAVPAEAARLILATLGLASATPQQVQSAFDRLGIKMRVE